MFLKVVKSLLQLVVQNRYNKIFRYFIISTKQ